MGQIEDIYIEKDKEAKDLQYRLKKKSGDLNEATNALCELQREFDAKIAEIEENECLRTEKERIYQRIESDRNRLQAEYGEICKKFQQIEAESKAKNKELIESQTTLKNTLNKLQQITLQNEALKDDLDTISKDNNGGVIEKKYLRAKVIIKELKSQQQEIKQQFKQSIERKKERELRYENAIAQWKQHSEELKEKIDKKEKELVNLRPSKAKTRKYEELCKEYHRAKVLHDKKNGICRETQTYECRLDQNGNNKENINQYSTREQAV